MSKLYVPVVPLVAALESAGRAAARADHAQAELLGIRVQLSTGSAGGLVISATDRYRAARTRMPEHPALAGRGDGTGQTLVYRTSAADLVRALKKSDSYTATLKGRGQGAALVEITDDGTLVVSTLPDQSDASHAAAWHDAEKHPNLDQLFPDADTDLVQVTFSADLLSRLTRGLDLMRGHFGEKDMPVRLFFGDQGTEQCTITQSGREEEIAIKLTISATPVALAGSSVSFRPSFLVDAINTTGAGARDEVALWFSSARPAVFPVLFRRGDEDPRDDRYFGHLVVPVTF